MRVKTGLTDVFLDEPFHRLDTDAVAVAADEQRVFIPVVRAETVRQILVDRVGAGLVQIDRALLAALAGDAHGITLKVGKIETDELGYAQTAVEKQRQNTVIALGVFALHGFEQFYAVIGGQIHRKRFADSRGLEACHRIGLEQMLFVGQIAKKCADRGDLACARIYAQAELGIRTVLLRGALAGHVFQIIIGIAQRHGFEKVNVDIIDGNAVDRQLARHETLVVLEHTQEQPQIKIIFVGGPGGLALDGRNIGQKIAQDARRIGGVFGHRSLHAENLLCMGHIISK